MAKWGREGVSPGESRRVSLPLSAKLLETREPASCCRMGRPPAGPPPPTPCPPARRRRSHLLHYRVVLNWTAPCASRSARARAGRAAGQEGGAGQSPPSPPGSGQRGQGRDVGSAFPLFTPLPNPKMSALLDSQSLEEGVARDSSLPFPLPPHSLSPSLPPPWCFFQLSLFLIPFLRAQSFKYNPLITIRWAQNFNQPFLCLEAVKI